MKPGASCNVHSPPAWMLFIATFTKFIYVCKLRKVCTMERFITLGIMVPVYLFLFSHSSNFWYFSKLRLFCTFNSDFEKTVKMQIFKIVSGNAQTTQYLWFPSSSHDTTTFSRGSSSHQKQVHCSCFFLHLWFLSDFSVDLRGIALTVR